LRPIPHVIERATLSDSVGFLRGLRFPPTYITNRPILFIEPYIHYKSPNIVYRANNVLVDAQLSTQYLKKNTWTNKVKCAKNSYE
jgi:hypothetical protein